MKVAVGIFLVIFLTLQRGSHGMFTPLEIDNHPCQTENLKVLPFFVISEASAQQPCQKLLSHFFVHSLLYVLLLFDYLLPPWWNHLPTFMDFDE